MKKLVIALIASSVLAGCTTIDPYSREQKTGNAAKGAGIGVLAGALIGSAVSGKGDRTKGAAIGALVGGAAGGGIGYYMDQQEALLRQKLEGTGVSVERVGDEIRLIMPGNVTFQTNSYQIASNFYPVLDSVAIVLTEFDKTALSVNGFTDSTGSFEHNQKLSEQRAASVANHLAQNGIKVLRISTQGYGERYPVADNGNASGRALNRRVEINIRGTQK
ncbi:OmpA family protein [Neptunomonas sp.]|uniref:OmpA family protein n=1 Tax=Neptunomonas sp. TaxID=1971898 RepID=UPI0025D66193|nr:OmpA family protein [Neptunomonas sp.]